MTTSTIPAPGVSRRNFLGAFSLAGVSVPFVVGCSLIPPIPKRPAPTATSATGWIQLNPKGQWQLWSPLMEMGQNVLSALRQVAAIELGWRPNVSEWRFRAPTA